MIKSSTAKSTAAIAAAAFIAGVTVFLTSGVPNAKAEPQVKDALHQLPAKNAPLRALMTGTACSLRGWPHYEQGCLFDLRGAADEAPTVRIVTVR